MMNPWEWLRAKTRAAVLDGFADAVETIDGGRIDRLQERLTLALPAPAASNRDTGGTEAAGKARAGKGGGK